MLGLIRRSLSDLFDLQPIKLDFPSFSSSSSSPPSLYTDDALRDLDFDIYEHEDDSSYYSSKTSPLPPPPPSQAPALSFVNLNSSYDWAFSFREASKSEKRVILEVSVERYPKDFAPAPVQVAQYETCCVPVSPSISPTNTGAMTLLRGSGSSSSSSRNASYTETTDLISEEEQNMILAAIIASQCDDFDRQIPGHIRDEIEHAEYVAALEASKELAEESAPPPPPQPPRPTVAPIRSATFAAPTRKQSSPRSASPTTPRSLSRTNSDIPWTNKKGENVPGESEQQQKFRELLQFHAVAAASIANAQARTGMSNITGNEDASDFDWVG
ncbi:hypothetical protein H072_3691 [Dactylellina haptotyla CBS 200.50]|uniref:Uncharacterized protein n=1 Tax=Dactylellina haptotyla (strain CBS 200.50) TaxID=1284197 RepID=S8BSC3_DACHA|nr:hypothetical protein H072_3691 [Dactylellina haptotyla CBS 200.50]